MSNETKKSNIEAQLDAVSEQKATLDRLLTKIKKQHFIAGMTDRQYNVYFREVKILEIVIRRLKKDASNNLLPSDILAFASLIMTHAYAVGTYKYPGELGSVRSIFGFYAKGRSTEMPADDATALERNDQQFAKRTRDLRAQGMREKLAQARKPAGDALMDAIKSVRGDGPSDHPSAEAGRIRILVNKTLGQSGWPPVSRDTIYLRLKKFPCS
jgi:hypothetical protein